MNLMYLYGLRDIQSIFLSYIINIKFLKKVKCLIIVKIAHNSRGIFK